MILITDKIDQVTFLQNLNNGKECFLNSGNGFVDVTSPIAGGNAIKVLLLFPRNKPVEPFSNSKYKAFWDRVFGVHCFGQNKISSTTPMHTKTLSHIPL